MQPSKKIWFRDLSIKNGLMIADEQVEQLDYYVILLLEWNKKINIISRKDVENIWTSHILHCISPLFKLDIKKNSTIIDIGTGGGLPGIPIKILRPDLSLICIDSTGKKINAVSQMIIDLKLKNINAVWGRAEEIGLRPEFTGNFDFVIARSVAPLKELLFWAKNFLRKRDQVELIKKINVDDRMSLKPPALLAFKGGDLSQEIETAKRRQPQMDVQVIDLAFFGSEKLNTSDKKILVVHF
jgi:16S rRNA (guanine527-N7)-methyltransferase